MLNDLPGLRANVIRDTGDPCLRNPLERQIVHAWTNGYLVDLKR